jgi:hypothetical protein
VSSGSCTGSIGNVSGTADYGDGGGATPLSVSGCSFSLAHTYGDEGSYAVTVRLSDSAGNTAVGTARVGTADVTPVVNIAISPPTKKVVTGSVSVNDPSSDPITLTVDYGDGTGLNTISLGSGRTAQLNHTYQSANSFTITVTATDDDGTQGTASHLTRTH